MTPHTRRLFFCLAICAGLVSHVTFALSMEATQRNGTTTYSSIGIQSLSLVNNNGNTTIQGWDQDSIKIETTIAVETSNTSTASELINQVLTDEKIADNNMALSWRLNSNIEAAIPVMVNYKLYVPRQLSLNVSGAQGHMVVENLDGGIELHFNNGSVNISKLRSKNGSRMVFGSCNVKIIETGLLSIESDNSQLQIQNCTELQLSTNFCSNYLKDIGKATCKSNFNKYLIESIDQIDFKGTNSRVDVTRINRYGLFEIDKGNLIVRQVSPQVSELNISNRDAPVELFIKESMPFFINGQNDRGDFIYPWPDKISIVNDMSAISFSGQNGQTSGLSTKLILFNQQSLIQIKPE